MSQRPESDRSCYLEEVENDALLQFIHEQDGVSLATAIAEVWSAPEIKNVQWTKIDTGVVCFVKDYTKRSYFFRLYSLDFCLLKKRPEQVWEHQLYLPFSYSPVTSFFHYFEQDDSYVGLNFSFDDEADKFNRIIMSKVADRSRRYLELMNGGGGTCVRSSDAFNRLPRSVSMKEDSYKTTEQYPKTPMFKTKFNYSNLKTNGASYLTSLFKSKFGKYSTKKTPMIGKQDISSPRNPRHLQHIRVANDHLEVNLQSQDESTQKMQEILEDLQLDIPMTRKTREFIDSFVQEHGGYDMFDDAIRLQKMAAPVKVYPSPRDKPQAPIKKKPLKPNAPPPPLPAKPAMRPSPTSPELSRILSPPQSPKDSGNRVINFNDTTSQLEQTSGPLPLNSTAIFRSQSALSPPPIPPPPLPRIFSKPEAKADPVEISANEEPAKQPFISIISLSPPASSTSASSSSPGSSGSTDSDKSDPRHDLLSSIQNFQGFSNKSKLRTPEVRPADTVASPNQLPLIDQLRVELLKRAQYLNSDSDDDDDESNHQSDAEWC